MGKPVVVPIVQLTEVAVVVSDLDRSVRFYTGRAGVGVRGGAPLLHG
jgi:hypothetical protein